MTTISSTSDLKIAIQLLEVEQAHEAQLLNEHFSIFCERIKPINLIKSALKDVTSTPDLLDNFLGTTMGMGTGYLSKKLVVGGSGNIFRNILGSLLQMGVTNLVAKHSKTIKLFGQIVLQTVLPKKSHPINESNIL